MVSPRISQRAPSRSVFYLFSLDRAQQTPAVDMHFQHDALSISVPLHC